MSEFIQFLKDVISICRKNDAAKGNLDSRLTPMEESINRLDAVFKMEQGSDLTEEIATLDERRDRAIVCLTLLARGYTSYFEDTKRRAAEKIGEVLDKYGSSIQKLNYQAETTTLSNLVNDLESDVEVAVALNTLGLQPLVDELKTSNLMFNERYLARLEEMSQMPEESAVELRSTAVRQYRDLVDLIDAHAVISGPGMYQDLINQMNELIESYNATTASRRGQGASETEEEGI